MFVERKLHHLEHRRYRQYASQDEFWVFSRNSYIYPFCGHHLGQTSFTIDDSSTNNFQAVVKQFSKLTVSEKNTFWSGRINDTPLSACIMGPLSVLLKVHNDRRVRIPTVQMPGQPGTLRIQITAGSAFSVVQDGPRDGQRAWVALREKLCERSTR